MKPFLSALRLPLLVLFFFLLAGCASEATMTEEEQAAEYGLTVEQFRKEKKAAARMNMNVGKHKSMIKQDE
ncbi:MAG: hypothetical protein AAB853_03965 [Patescibacteria group bacterium]